MNYHKPGLTAQPRSTDTKPFRMLECLASLPEVSGAVSQEPTFELEFGEFVFAKGWLTDERRAELDAAMVWIASELESTGGHAAIRFYADRAIVAIVVKYMHSVGWIHDWLRGWAAGNGIAYDHNPA